jgi:hypothetical protein
MLLKAVLVFIVPLVALGVGIRVFDRLPEYKAIQHRIVGEKPLYRSVEPIYARPAGYSAEEAAAYWQLLAEDAASERHMLKVDLAFPVFYGTAFAAALLLAWSTLGWSFSRAWLLAPVVVLVAADWTENITLLGQLAQLSAGNALSPLWIGVASLATQLKLGMLVVCVILTTGSAGCLTEHYFKRTS